jgi:hypothetical protein
LQVILKQFRYYNLTDVQFLIFLLELMKNIILFFSFTFLSISLLGQNYKVIGQIIDSLNAEPLISANVVLVSTYDSSIFVGTSTDADGKFSLEAKPGSYRIRVSFVGFGEYSKRVFIQDKNIDLGKIKLSESLLAEVNVEGKIPPAVLKGDTTEYNAKAFKTNPDATAEDLVEKMPGVTIQNGKVQAQGEDVKQVLVDGKPFFGNDAKATLKNIPAEMIDKVQVYDQGSDQSRMSGFDDGNTSKTINIISKPEYRSGNFGRAYAAGGYDDDFKAGGERYKLGAVFNSFNGSRRISVLGQFNNINEQNFSSDDLAGVMSSGGGQGGGGMGGGRGGMGGGGGGGGWGMGGGNVGQFLVNDQGGITQTNAFGINYSDKWGKKFDVSGSYFFNYTQNNLLTLGNQLYITKVDTGLVYDKIESSISKNMNHRANFRIDYKINDKNSIAIAPKFSLQMNDGSSNLFGETNKSGEFLSSTSRDFASKVNAWTFSNSLTYSLGFEKKGRSLTMTISNDHKKNDANSSLRATNTLDSILQMSDTLDQNANLNQFENSISSRIEYSEPLGEFSQLQFLYNPSFNFNNIDKSTFEKDNQSNDYTIEAPLLSTLSNNIYQTQQGGIGWRYNKQDLNIQARVSFQWAGLGVDQINPTLFNKKYNFYSVLPFAQLRYKISKVKNLRITYRSYTNAPTMTQLQEAINNTNPLQLSAGNATLKQEEVHRLHMNYSAPNPEKNTMFFAMLMFTFTNNFIGSSNYIARVDTTLYGAELPRGAQLTRFENISNKLNVFGYTTFGIPIKKLKSNLNLNLSASYNRTPGKVNDEINYANTPTGTFGVTLSSNISSKLDFTLSSNTTLNTTFNTLNKNLDSKFLNQNSKLRFYWNPWKTLVFRTDVSHQLYSGLGDGFLQNFVLWNASIATKVFKNQQGELAFLVFDILGQNNSISRNFYETYIETNISTVLQRYFMLQFTYKFKPKKGDIDLQKEKEELERMKMYRGQR